MDVGVYGLGRFGSFWAAALAGHLAVGAWSRSPSHPLPPGVRALADPDSIVFVVKETREEVIAPVVAAEAVTAEPELIGRAAKEAEEAEEGEEKSEKKPEKKAEKKT